MKLLFDENLSPKLIQTIHNIFPDSKHVTDVLGQQATDTQIWEYAIENEFSIVSKDNDFRQRFFSTANSPNIIWLSIGNTDTTTIEKILKTNKTKIQELENQAEKTLLVLKLE